MTNTEYLARYDLLPKGGHVLCALSGGRDSVYLLHRLLAWGEEYDLTVSAAHFNHKLRDIESDRDEAFVRQLCQAWNVPLYVGAGDVRGYAKQHGMGIEEAARTMRYAFLEQTLGEIGGSALATAHHADDLAETMLMNLVRGAGTKGLSGIPPKRGNIIRPILLVTRKEIDDYLKLHELSYVEDSTNALDDCTRNLLRHRVMPVLEQMNPMFAARAAGAAMLLRADDDCLQQQADGFLEANSPDEGIEIRKLTDLHEAVASRVIRSVWGSGLTQEHVRCIMELCHGEGLAYVHIPNGVVRRDGGRLWSDHVEEIPEDRLLAGDSGEIIFGNFGIVWQNTVMNDEVHNSFNTFLFKYESIKGNVTATVRRDGDRVKLVGRGCTKKLKQLFQEKKLTQPQRAMTPVLRDEQGIIGVFGFGIAQRCVAEIGDKILKVQVIKKKRNGG